MKTNSISLQWNPIEILSILHDVTIFIIIIKKISKECCTSIPKILHPLPKYTSSSDIQKDGSRSRFARIRLARLNLGRENQPRPWPNRRRGHPYDPPPPPLLLVSVGVSDEPGPLSWTQQATRPEREANKHRRYITRRPQIPSGPLNGPNEKQRDNGRPGLVQREREKERKKERGERGDYSLVCLNTQRGREPLYQKDRENVAAGLTDIYESFTRQPLSLPHSRSLRSNFLPRGFAIFDAFEKFQFHSRSWWRWI